MNSNVIGFARTVDAAFSHQTGSPLPDRADAGLGTALQRGYNFQINLDLHLQSPTVSDWIERITTRVEPLVFPLVLHIPASGRYLTAEEQKIFHRALKRSVKFVAFGRPISE